MPYRIKQFLSLFFKWKRKYYHSSLPTGSPRIEHIIICSACGSENRPIYVQRKLMLSFCYIDICCVKKHDIQKACPECNTIHRKDRLAMCPGCNHYLDYIFEMCPRCRFAISKNQRNNDRKNHMI